MIQSNYIISGAKPDSPSKSDFADICQLKVTFFDRTHQTPALGKSIIVDFKKEGVLKNHTI